MIHEMRLDPVQFDEISAGLKKVESRLYDEKRQKLHMGDTIIFYKLPECTQSINTKILQISHYKNIQDLVEGTPLEYWGPRFKSKQQLLDAKWQYSEEDIQKYGLIAIYIHIQ